MVELVDAISAIGAFELSVCDEAIEAVDSDRAAATSESEEFFA